MRETVNYTNKVYILIQSDKSSDFYFYSYVASMNYLGVSVSTYYYSFIQGNGIINCFMSDVHYDSEESIKNYTLKEDVIKGKTVIGVRRCI